MFKVFVSDKLGQAGLEILEAADDVEVTVNTSLDEAGLVEAITDYDGLIIRSGTTVTENILKAAKNLKVVGRAGVGVDNVDIESATRHGVIVMNTPSANTIATAEHALALMLSVSRHIVPAHNSLAAGEWKRSNFGGSELRGKMLGVIGYGRVGRAVAARAKAFEMNVLVYDPYVSETVAKETGVELANLDEVLAASDYVTLHSVLNEETQNLINTDRIALMKDSAVLINVARGGLVDADAVATALDEGKLSAAGLDVFAVEPPKESNRLVNHPKVVHTPHLGASTAEAQRDVAIDVATQVVEALRGDKITNCVNLGFSSGASFDRLAPFIELAEKIGAIQAAMAENPITSIEVEVLDADAEELLKPVAAGLMKGLLASDYPGLINYVNAPVLGQEQGLAVSRAVGIGGSYHRNHIACRVKFDGGQRTISGVVYEGDKQRIVQISSYRFEADPHGPVLLLLNNDVPGVVGSAGTALGECGINIAEWRLGRDEARDEALSFVNLDRLPSDDELANIKKLDPVVKAIVLDL